jgi:hypothetical protein
MSIQVYFFWPLNWRHDMSKKIFGNMLAALACALVGVVSTGASAQVLNVVAYGYYGGENVGANKGNLFILFNAQPGSPGNCGTTSTDPLFLTNRIDIPPTHSRVKQFAQLAALAKVTGSQIVIGADGCYNYASGQKSVSIKDDGNAGYMYLQ